MREGVDHTGAELAERYYRDVVRPLLDEHRPGLGHAAGLLGSGSEVIGLDDVTSRDHDWGLRLTLLLDADSPGARDAGDASGLVDDIDNLLERVLPQQFLGLPTRFATSWRHGQPHEQPRHQVEVADLGTFVATRLGVDLGADAARPLDVLDWLTLTGQSVLEVTAGPLFADTSGQLTALRRRLDWYPDDVWAYVVAAAWSRLGQELPFVGRTASRGDDIGSRVIAARLAHTAMHLSFLLERRWPPYPKWLGTDFAAGLGRSGHICPALPSALARALAATDWPEREASLCAALELLGAVQAEVGLPSIDPVVVPFWDRPFRTVDNRIVDALYAMIQDPAVRTLPRGVGSVEQWVDNVDVLTHPARRAAAVRTLAFIP